MGSLSNAKFKLALLGGFELTGPNGVADLGTRKIAGLLAFLVCMAPKPQMREQLKDLLWGSHFDEQARQNLRQAISKLRRTLGDEALWSEGEKVCLAPGAVVCDLDRFEMLVRDGTRETLIEALQIYKGPLLAGVSIPEEAWVEWVTAQRQRVEGLAVDAMVKLGDRELELGDHESALAAGKQALAINNLREDAHRLVLRALAASGRRPDALKHYESLIDLLKRELNVAPDLNTIAVADDLRRSSIRDPALSPAERNPSLPTDRPSIAVLPFANLSGDPEQEYFAEGIAEEITTALSHCRSLLVIARNSSFAYKGKGTDVRQVGQELGVRYVLEGSVRRDGGRVRFTGQLIDTLTGKHVWADRFEGEVSDIFALQDRFSESVVAIIEPRVQLAEIERLKHKPAGNLSAYDLVLRAQRSIYEWSVDGVEAAVQLLKQALAIDAEYPLALAMLANCYSIRHRLGWSKDNAEVVEGLRLAARAVEIDNEDSEVLWRAASAVLYLGMDVRRAGELIFRALEINPNSSIALTNAGWIELYLGKPDPALDFLQRAERLNPRDPRAPLGAIASARSFTYYQRGEYGQAVEWAEKAHAENPQFPSALWLLAAARARLGETIKAANALNQALQIEPKLTISALRTRSMFVKEEVWLDVAKGLRLAGMPE